MSNCLELHNIEVIFSNDDFDIDAFLKVLDEHKDHSRVDIPADDNFCWFLKYNSIVDDGKLKIRFGEGASTHTWRDLAWTVNYLGKFMKKERVHIFKAADEYDGFDDVFNLKVVFGRKYDKFLDEVKNE